MAISDNIFNAVLRAFENVYAERGAYRELAQTVSGWREAFESAMEPEAPYRKEVAQTFATLKEHLLDKQKAQDTLLNLGKGLIH